MKSPSHVGATLAALREQRLAELFILQRIKRQLRLLHVEESRCLARLESLSNKERWEFRRLAAESK